MRYAHRMPFGAELLDEGGCRFRLWAPGAHTVELVLERPEGTRRRLLEPIGDGWYELIADDVVAGDRYRYRIDGAQAVPDPASRFQPDDVHGASRVIDPNAWSWRIAWHGRPWSETVLYELHVGTFSPEGTFDGVRARLDYLAELGVTAVELMPVADFPGQHNWGYDGVLPFAPDARYGTPEQLKALVDAAHERGLMIFLDVVYNHFGPEGNYLHTYAPQFFTERHHTPWGAAINFDGRRSRWVRQFFIENALYWLEEYRFDGLRFDAVHAIIDDSSPDILDALAQEVAARIPAERQVHLVLENDANQARYLRPREGQRPYEAQWNDDIHHALHVALTQEAMGYYADYADDPVRHLGRCLAEGFAWQGEPSTFRDGAPRGEPSADLAPRSFVAFLQNHDQVGNRAFGERIHALSSPAAVRAATTILLLAPSPPLLFMGQEWGSQVPFLFFCDFEPSLAPRVTEGRRQEFARFPEFNHPDTRERIPDPAAPATFDASRLDWLPMTAEKQTWLAFHRHLLALRQREVVPLINRIAGGSAHWQPFAESGLSVTWRLAGGGQLVLIANLGSEPIGDFSAPAGRCLHATPEEATAWAGAILPAWSAAWYLSEGPGARLNDEWVDTVQGDA